MLLFARYATQQTQQTQQLHTISAITEKETFIIRFAAKKVYF